MTTQDIIVGQINSELGKLYAEGLRPAALIEIAQWCESAADSLMAHGAYAEQADAGIFDDAAKSLRALAKVAGASEGN